MKSYTPDMIYPNLDLKLLEATWCKNEYFSDHNTNSTLLRNVTIIPLVDTR